MTLTSDRVESLPFAERLPARTAIVVPAYNEAKHLPELVRRCLAVGPERLVLIDDASTDATPEVVQRVLASLSADDAARVTALRNPSNLGKQGSVRRGLRALAGLDLDAVALIDGDLQHDPAELPPLVTLVTDGFADVVIGARRHDEMPRHRRVSNWLVNAGFRLVGGFDPVDVQSGLRVYTKVLADAVAAGLPERGGYRLEHESLAVLARTARATGTEIRIAAAPISCHYGDAVSTLKKRDVFKLAMETVRQARRIRRAGRPLPAVPPRAEVG